MLGGDPVIAEPVARYPSIGAAEAEAVAGVMGEGVLSGFYGSWREEFGGGPRVRAFEEAWCARFGVSHTVSVNSNTSGLFASMGAVGVSPGDEVIVPATTMSATAMAPLIYGGIPVFADLDPDTFCLSTDSVRANLTERTRAVLAVNLFGHPAPLHELRKLCDERGIFLVEDNAQSILASEHGRPAGTVGHISVFSLNVHKHVHTGEGGMCTTADDDLAQRLRLIRNHAEAVVESAGVADLTNLVGFNLRMTELSAAVGLAQLADVEAHVGRRRAFAEALSAGLSGLAGVQVPFVREGCVHAWYNWMLKYDETRVGMPREAFLAALRAEGFPCFAAYVKPLYFLPLFRDRIAIGRDGFPFTLTERRYEAGLCPVAERLHDREFLGVECCAHDTSGGLAERMVEAFRKVYALRGDLAVRDGAQRAANQ